MGQTMTIDITSKVFVLLAAYTLVHAAVYFWYQSQKQAVDDAQDNPAKSDNITAPRRRIASGIHSTPSRHHMFLRAAMLLAALILSALVVFSAVR